jgi:chemotaxis protein methyltransferase CheR
MIVPLNVELSPTEFQLFQALLVAESGLHFDADRQGTLCAALAERMAARGVDAPAEYYRLLTSGAETRDELHAFIDLVTIGETYFFRNEPQFAALRDHIVPGYVRDRLLGARRINVWSAACSTGEEPYSIAMMLLETLPAAEAWNVSVLATDVNRDHLRRARRAVYSPRAVRLVPPAWLEKYFTRRGAEYVLRDEVKRRVTFEHHNLVADPFARPEMQHVDLLFCRNVTIYFPLPTTRAVMEKFAGSLASDGWFFIGDAETLWQVSDRFKLVEIGGAFLYRHADRVPVVAPPLPPPPPSVVAPVLPVKSSPASPKRAPVDTTALVNDAVQLADAGRDDDALATLQRVIAADNLAAEAYYLTGVILARAGRTPEAITALRRVIYIDPTAALAYASLAGVYRSTGETGKARREFQNAIRTLAGLPDEQPVRFSPDIQAGYLRTVCERSLA